jgi:sarcosine oxidase, subunit delta
MSFQIDCPNCGIRPVWEFHFGGPVRQRPGPDVSDREWTAYLYDRPTTCGEQAEWWYHRSACKLWFGARRETRHNQVLESMRPGGGA